MIDPDLIESEKSQLGPFMESQTGSIIEDKEEKVESRNLEAIEISEVSIKGEKWAVIIGISKYQDSSLNLQYAHRDAEEFYNILTKPNEGFFKLDHVLKLINEDASQKRINKALKQFLKKPAKDDLVLLYFACHGAFDPDRPHNSYILPYDTDPDDIASTSLPMREIDASIKENLNATKVIIIADACHSAAIGGDIGRRAINSTATINKFLKDLANSMDGTALITSAEANEVALEGEQWGDGHGVFTHYLIEGLKGEADGYGGGGRDGIISIGELFEYVRDKVKEATEYKQHPLIGSSRFDRSLPITYVNPILENETVFSETVSSVSKTASSVSVPVSNKILVKMFEAEQYERDEDYDSAISCYEDAIAIDPSNPDNYLPYNRMGNAHFRMGSNDEAIKSYQGAINAKPEHPDAYDLKGHVYFKLGKYVQALEYYDKAWKIKPKSFQFLKDKGLALYKLKDYEQAITYFDESLNKKPNQSKILEFKDEAVRNLKEINELKKGMSFYDSGKFEEALDCFNKVLEINSTNIQTLYYRGLSLAQLSQFDEAVSSYEKALKIDPSNNEIAKAKELAIDYQRQKRISLLIDEGLQYNKNNDYQNAIDSFDKAIIIGPENYVPYYQKGNVLFKLHEYDEALKCYDRTLELEPDHYYAWYNKGEIFNKRCESISTEESSKYLECYNEAKICYDRALEIKPNKAEAWYRKGTVLEKLARHSKSEIRDDEAMKCYDRALEIKPDYIEVHYSKGQILFGFGKYEEAIKSFDEALKIKPTFNDAAKARELAHEKQIQRKISQIIEEADRCIKNEDYENAIKLLDKGIVVNQNDHSLYKRKGDLLAKMGRYDEGIKCYETALEIYPKDADVLTKKGITLNMLTKYVEAVTDFDKALGLEPDNVNTLYHKGQALFNSLKYEEAIKSFDEALKIKPTFNEAAKARELAHEKQKEKETSLFVDEGLKYVRNGNYNAALSAFDKAISAKTENHIAYNLKGAVYFILERYNEAIECYDKALKINPKYLDVLKDKGMSLHKLGKYKQAISCFDEALKIDPTYNEAVKAKERAVEALKKQEKISTATHRGLDYLKNKDYDNAITSLDIALAIDPKNVIANSQKGDALYELGKYEQAIQCYEKVLEIDSNNKIIENKIVEIEDIRKKQVNFIKSWGREGKKDGQFINPHGISVDAIGNVYVTDTDNHRIQKFDSYGNFITKWGREGKKDGQFINPWGISVDVIGNVYVTDTDNRRIQKFAINKARQEVITIKNKDRAEESLKKQRYLDKAEQSVNAEVEVKHAIVIGINEYENKDIPRLLGAENDATELYKSLTNHALGFTVAAGHYLLGEDATYKQISKTVGELFRKNTDESTDLILFYFSGHGFVDEETKQAYIAPYDFDPNDPEFCGIRLDDLRNAAFGSKTKANILMVLDCCYAGIVTKGTKGNSAQTKNIYAEEVQVPFSQNVNPYSQDRDGLLIASSKADEISKEKINCQHSDYVYPHTHGALSYHLIKGLEGGAADKLGLITIESLQKYLEDQMVSEGKQRPLHSSIDESFMLDKIRIGKSQGLFKAKIEEFIRDVKSYSCKTDLRSLRMAAQNIKGLEELDKDNTEIPILIKNVNDTLENMQARKLINNWLITNQNIMHVPMMIERIRKGLFDRVFYNFADNLSYDILRDIDDTNFQYLILVFNEARNKYSYPTKTTPELIRLIERLKEISRQQGTTSSSSAVNKYNDPTLPGYDPSKHVGTLM